jgi:polygalacturonase
MTNRRRILQGFAATGVISAFPVGAEAAVRRAGGASPWSQVDAIIARIRRPRFPARDFPLPMFGAAGDGMTNCTQAFARAVDACAASGGGRVVVPEGVWLTGAIHLKSNVNLYVSRGATIRFSTDPADYLPLVFTRWEGVELMNYSPLVYAFEQENIAVTGEGALDGQADSVHWWPWKGKEEHGWSQGRPNQDTARNTLFAMGDNNVPVEKRVFGEGFYLRPNFIEPYRCKNVLIEGVTLRNAPFWEVHPTLCTSVTVRIVTVDSSGPNTDGCDPESCKDVLIENCFFNTGDDCIAIKSGRNGDGRRVNVPTENVVIRNCTMKNGHGGVTIGSEITGGVRNVFAQDCRMDSPDLWNAIRLKDNAMRGGVLENLNFRRLVVGQVAHAVLTIDFNYEEAANGPFVPVVRGVHLESVVSGKSRYGIDAQGLASAPIYDVTLRGCDFRDVAQDNIVKNVRGLSLRDVKINGRAMQTAALGPAR